jgi:ATP-binding cassette subfamily B protein
MPRTTNKEALAKAYAKMPSKIQSLLKQKIDLDGIKKIAVILLVLYLISASFDYIEQIIMTKVSNTFSYDLRKRISSKINRLKLVYFDKNQVGDVLSRVVNDVDTLTTSMDNSISTIVSSVLLVIGTVIMMFATNAILALTAILSSLIGFFFTSKILVRSQKYFDRKQEELGKVNGHIEETFSGLEVVKTYNAKEQVLEQFNNLNDNLYNASWKSNFLSGLMPPIMNFISDFTYILVCVMGAYLTLNNLIKFGTIVAFILYARSTSLS